MELYKVGASLVYLASQSCITKHCLKINKL